MGCFYVWSTGLTDSGVKIPCRLGRETASRSQPRVQSPRCQTSIEFVFCEVLLCAREGDFINEQAAGEVAVILFGKLPEDVP